MIYLDTSAFLKLYIREEGSEEVQARVMAQDHPLPVWDVLEAEFINALRLKVFWKEMAAEPAEAQIKLFQARLRRGNYFAADIRRGELMATYRRLSGETGRLGCRTMDILHVACALELRASVFLSFDARQVELARFAGLAG